MNPIDTNGITPSSRVETDRKAGGAKADSTGSGSSAPVAKEDTVELTDTASRLSQLLGEISAAPGVDIERVDAIRQQIADGSYQVDPERIAGELVKQEVEFF